MRLFVAVDIDETTRAQLDVARDAIQSVIGHARVPPRVTWVKPDAAHVTLRFIGETAEDTLAAIQRALADIEFAPFEVTWQSIGTFGGNHNPRVIWVGPSTGVEPFVELASRVNERLEPLIGPAARRPFRPHVTLGRVKVPGTGVDWTHALSAFQFEPTVTRVEHVTLYQSRLSSKGPTYTAMSTHG